MEFNYNIPNWNKAKFEKAIRSMKRKGLDVKCQEVGPTIETVDNIDYMCTAYIIESEILYQVQGWQFVGTIEHKDSGNIIRKAFEIEVPERYYSAPNECEHCHTIRNRIDTYLVHNESTGEFKQVGKACLKAYTGLNPALCTLAMTLESEIAKYELDEEEVRTGGYNAFGSFRGYDAEYMKRVALAEIKAHGYRKETEENCRGIKKATKYLVQDLYYVREVAKAPEEEVQEIDNWVAFLDISHNDYLRNATTAYKAKYYEPRDMALVCSLISYYLKDKQFQAEAAIKAKLQQEKAKASQELGYAGEVGQKIEFEVAEDSILFKNEPYSYYGDWSYTHKIIDTEGYTILWSTADKTSHYKEFPAGIKIMATIKAHKEFRGELQTVVTRGKLLTPLPEISLQ